MELGGCSYVMEYQLSCCNTWEVDKYMSATKSCLITSYLALFSQAMEIVEVEDMLKKGNLMKCHTAEKKLRVYAMS